MQYSPKLKKAAEEIKEILKRYDIAALVVLHTPGHSEFVCELQPSYSCASFEGNFLRIKAKKADYPTLEAWKQKATDTANMLHHLSTTCGEQVMALCELSKRVDDTIQAEYDDGGFTSHSTQNN